MVNKPLYVNPKSHLVVFTGAGISAESNIPTYRDEEGMWKHLEIVKLMSVGGYYENPVAVLEILNDLRLKCSQAQPNNAHRILAELESMCHVTVITQNVDDLHERAGSSHVIHVHGQLSEVTSSNNRCDPECIIEFPLEIPIRLGDKAKDGSQLRPNVVLFGEYLTAFSEAANILRTADIFLLVGTSLKVFPASRLINFVPVGIPCYRIDSDKSIMEELGGYTFLKGTATKGVTQFLEILRTNYQYEK